MGAENRARNEHKQISGKGRMKMKPTKRILWMLLALAVLLCAMTSGALAVNESGEEL